MRANGGDGRSGHIQCGGAREEDMGAPTGAQETIFVTRGKSKKTANQNEVQQTSQKKRKPTQNIQTKGHTAEIMFIAGLNAQ